MARRASRFPTELELAILDVVWNCGEKSITIRQVHDALSSKRKLAYNTILTIMTIMVRKGYLKRKMASTGLYHAYTAKSDQATTCKAMLMDIVERAYGGDVAAAIKDLGK